MHYKPVLIHLLGITFSLFPSTRKWVISLKCYFKHILLIICQPEQFNINFSNNFLNKAIPKVETVHEDLIMSSEVFSDRKLNSLILIYQQVSIEKSMTHEALLNAAAELLTLTNRCAEHILHIFCEENYFHLTRRMALFFP